jgi:MFS family permease
VVYACAGVCLSAGFIPQINLLLETCPHDSQQTHLAAANLLLSPGAVGAPLLAGYAAEHFGLRAVFIASLFFSAAALFWLLRFFREPRAAGQSPLPLADA